MQIGNDIACGFSSLQLAAAPVRRPALGRPEGCADTGVALGLKRQNLRESLARDS